MRDRVGGIIALLRGWLTQVHVRRAVQRLKVDEVASLGEKRFVAVVHFETERFLIGGSGNSVCLLAKLKNDSSFADIIDASKAAERKASN